jgi:thymidine phosphorylase
VRQVGFAIGMATGEIAPADRRLYGLRDVTATVDSRPLIIASILSKKLATGAAGIVFDLKTGDGAFLQTLEESRELATDLVEISKALGTPARALITDMNQPLGEWTGHACEVAETLAALAGEGPADLMEVTFALSLQVAELVGRPLSRSQLEEAIASGRARELFERWAVSRGAAAAWFRAPALAQGLALAPLEVVAEAERSGVLARVETRQLGLLLAEAGGGRRLPGDTIDGGISLRMAARLGQPIAAGQELARLYLRRPNAALEQRFRSCFKIADTGTAPTLIGELIQ